MRANEFGDIDCRSGGRHDEYSTELLPTSFPNGLWQLGLGARRYAARRLRPLIK
jgi:hypothetical protein